MKGSSDGKKPKEKTHMGNVYKSGKAARDAKLSQTQNQPGKGNSTGSGVIGRGNRNLAERTGSDRYRGQGNDGRG